jgi:hypothetical protein
MKLIFLVSFPNYGRSSSFNDLSKLQTFIFSSFISSEGSYIAYSSIADTLKN